VALVAGECVACLGYRACVALVVGECVGFWQAQECTECMPGPQNACLIRCGQGAAGAVIDSFKKRGSEVRS
jgi:hypothetical protein